MMTDKQLQALLLYIDLKAGEQAQFAPTPEHETRQARRAVIEAFGFFTDRRGNYVSAHARAICKSCSQTFTIADGHECPGIRGIKP